MAQYEKNKKIAISSRDYVLALLVVTVWGANFTVIKLGLGGVPPMLLAALRFTLTALPAVAFIRRPAVEFRYCVAYGLTVGVGQFGCLFYAMDIGMPAGVASVVLQSQVLFTLLFAAIFLRESIMGSQLVGLVVAAVGLYLIGGNVDTVGVSAIPVFAFFLTLLGAVFWGISNIIVRYAADQAASRGERLDMLSMVVWASLIPPLPLLALALILDTPQAVWNALTNLDALSVFAVLYLTFGATLFGFGTWSGLLARYPASKVAPLSLLVPVTGLLTAQIILGEQLSMLQWVGGLVILFGLIVSTLGLPQISYLRQSKDYNVSTEVERQDNKHEL